MKQEIKIEEILLNLANSITPFELPIGVYITDKDGKIIEGNRRFREILNLPLDGPINASIKDYYENPEDRDKLISKLIECEDEGRFLEKEQIKFKIKEKIVWVEDFCKTIREKNDIVGFLGCLVDITEEKSFQDLFNYLPAGVFRLDKNDTFVRLNQAVAQMLGFDYIDEVQGKNIREFYKDINNTDILKEKSNKFGAIKNERVELLKKSGEPIFVLINAFKTPLDSDFYEGREGTIIDITAEETYRRILNDIPVGTFFVRLENDVEIIKECNEAFAILFEFDSVEQVKGTNIAELYGDPIDDHRVFKEALIEEHKKGRPIIGYRLRVKSKKGRNFVIEINTKLIVDNYGNEYGRAGVVYDVTDEVALREFRDDIGRVLHAYSSTLMSIQQSVSSILDVLRPDPFENKEYISIDEAMNILANPAQNLATAVKKLLEEENKKSTLSIGEDSLKKLTDFQKTLLEYQTAIQYPEHRHSILHDISTSVLNITKEFEKGTYNRELIKEVKKKAFELERLCCIFLLHNSIENILAMDLQIITLREYITFKRKPEEIEKICNVSSLITQAVHNLMEYTKSRNIKIIRLDTNLNIFVNVDERRIVRAIVNLLHNAIKYSWEYRKTGKNQIFIRCKIVNNEIWIEFENLGVPITEEEIKKELIFEYGYRGIKSGDRGRLGTGIGLSDARETARKYKGDVVIESLPQYYGYNKRFEKIPNKTTAILKLPLFVEGDKNEEKNTMD